MNKKNLIYLLTGLVVILIIVIVVLLVNNNNSSDTLTPDSKDQSSIQTDDSTTSESDLQKPTAPTDLRGNAISSSEIELTWSDNSDNEHGFRISRGSVLITTVPADSVIFRDTGLLPGETYNYSVTAYNVHGESSPCTASATTQNIKILITLDSIGVYDNRESILRGTGDIYLLIGIGEGSKSLKIRIPDDDYFSLGKDSTIEVNKHLYTSDGTSDSLQLLITGYESDGESFEQLAYDALDVALDYYTGGITKSLLEAFDLSLSDKIGELLGEEDDFLGSYELTCNKQNNYGIGQYTDIVLQDERGVDCLRLWFTIESSE